MGAQDINSHIASYGFETGVKQQFIMANEISDKTTRLYNEFMLDRDNLRPDYVVLFSDANEQVYNNTLKAASQWDIPVLKIDVCDLAQSQIDNINLLLNKFKINGDVNLLKEAIHNYESGASGFNLNLDGDLTNKTYNNHPMVESIYDKTTIKQDCIDYANSIVKLADKKKIRQFKEILLDIKDLYDNTNQREKVVGVLAHTKSMIDVDNLLNILEGDNG